MDWPSIVGAGVGAAGLSGVVVWGLVYRKGSEVWASKKAVEKMVTVDQLNGLGTRVSELAQKHEGIAKLADENHDNIALLDKDAKHQVQLMATSVVQPLQGIANRLEEMQKTQVRMLETQATHGSDLKALGRGFDEMKQRQNSLDDR